MGVTVISPATFQLTLLTQQDPIKQPGDTSETHVKVIPAIIYPISNLPQASCADCRSASKQLTNP